MIGLRNDPNMFGRLPDPPEPIECDGKFDKEKCECCMGYDECEKEELREEILTKEYIYHSPGKERRND